MRSLDIKLDAKIKTLNGKLQTISTEHSVFYGCENENNSGQLPAIVQLRKATNDKYLLYAFGANGEAKSEYEVTLGLKHSFLSREIDVTLKTDNKGIIDLGKLKDIQRVNYTGHLGAYKSWVLEEDSCVLPPAVCVSKDAPFKIACSTRSPACLYSLFRTATSE